jgi:hypothetical protein
VTVSDLRWTVLQRWRAQPAQVATMVGTIILIVLVAAGVLTGS